ncbi:MAG: NUDIX hydrolase, partial [Sediminibacterium sp.]|nr:NUDIX hydrolase [Sediminibacterium sp.]
MERDLRWKTLQSEYLYRKDWLNIRIDTCEKPDGKIISPYYVYEFTDWVCAFAITKNQEVVLERQYRHALQHTGLELPGGCVDASDPDKVSAIARELLEETGYQFDHFEMLGVTSSNPSTNSNLMYMFLATGGKKTGHQTLDRNEEIDVRLIPLETVREMLHRNEFPQA